uniref:Uncharacterized protein n=1 Tax=Coccidioides posadasii RMSCC 3488 TaxID=454284 RepID=A0A0J6F4Z8_COCPO|nr:hypothetical protein CPAG_01569 [Coccidioides posadasii RMSCC 3488]
MSPCKSTRMEIKVDLPLSIPQPAHAHIVYSVMLLIRHSWDDDENWPSCIGSREWNRLDPFAGLSFKMSVVVARGESRGTKLSGLLYSAYHFPSTVDPHRNQTRSFRSVMPV